MTPTPDITLDGRVLNDTFRISDLHRPFPDIETELVSVPGSPGQVSVATHVSARIVSFRLWSYAHDSATRMGEVCAVVESLMATKVHILQFSDEPNLIREVEVNGSLEYDEYERRGSVEVTFVMPDPYRLYAQAKTVLLAGSQGSFTLDHGMPRIAISATNVRRRVSDDLWQLTFDGTQSVNIRIPTPLAATVEADLKSGLVTADGERGVILLDSDWPLELAAGQHSVQVTAGSSTTTMTIVERCI